MPINLAEKLGLLPSHNYPEMRFAPPPDRPYRDNPDKPYPDNPELDEHYRQMHASFEAILDENGNPPPYYGEPNSPDSEFEGYVNYGPHQKNGLATPDSTNSNPRSSLPMFSIQTLSPTRNRLHSPPSGEVLGLYPELVRKPYNFARDIKTTVHRPITRSIGVRWYYLSSKPGKVIRTHPEFGSTEMEYSEAVWRLSYKVVWYLGCGC